MLKANSDSLFRRMSSQAEEFLKIALFYSAIPGGVGGIVTFLFGIKNGLYKNNRYKIKLLIELLGAMFTASFISPLVSSLAEQSFQLFVAFIIGVAWSGVIQRIRSIITRNVEIELEHPTQESTLLNPILSEYQELLRLIQEKIHYLKKAKIIEFNSEKKFRLEQEIKTLQIDQEQTEKEIEELKKILNKN